jgi:cytochrome c oxidase subunit 2
VGPDTRSLYDDLAALYLPIALAVVVLVWLAIAVAVWRGRRRRDASATSSHTVLEVTYAGLLALIVAVLVVATFHAEDDVKATPARPPLVIGVRAAKWDWRFTYADRGVVVQGTDTRPARLVVPAGRDVAFEATAADVVHAFWIPEMRFQRELIPGQRTRFDLRFPKPTFYASGRCSFFCGLRHQDMRFVVEVLPAARFEAWLRRGGHG